MEAAIITVASLIKMAYEYVTDKDELVKLEKKLNRIINKWKKMDKRTKEVDQVLFQMGEVSGMIKAKDVSGASRSVDLLLTIAGA